MPDYSKGKIYKVWSPSHPELGVYIGSTIQPLYKRLYGHKSVSNECSSKQLMSCDDIRIDLLEEYPCENKDQLNAKEGEWILKGGCVNRCVAGRSIEQYRIDEKDKIKKQYQQYRKEHSDVIKQIRKKYYEKNKEEIRRKSRERQKIYRENLTEEQKEKRRVYQREYMRKRREKE